jgi:hypothetical protein
MLHNIPEERRPHLHRGWSLKSRIRDLFNDADSCSNNSLHLQYVGTRSQTKEE